MMPSPVKKAYNPENIPLLVATASILQISETLLPHPIPGLRFGFANIVSLIILVQYGFKPALTVTLLRTVVSSFILGNFLSPGFILSFAGGLASICATGILYRISIRFDFFRVSPVGLGMTGAFVHNMVQITLAYLILIRLPGIFFLVPWLAFGALIFGAFSGNIATGIIKKLIQKVSIESIPIQPVPSYENKIFVEEDTLFHKSMPEIKFAIVLGLTLVVVLIENLMLYSFLFAVVLTAIPAAGLQYKTTFKIIRKLSIIILSTFLLPLYFNPGSHILIETPYFSLHSEAITSGVVFASRIILLALFSSILAQTTRTDMFTKGIQTFLKPFDRIGLNSEYISRTLFLSMISLPEVWDEIRSVIRFLLKGKKRTFKTLKETVIQLFVYIFSARNNRP